MTPSMWACCRQHGRLPRLRAALSTLMVSMLAGSTLGVPMLAGSTLGMAMLAVSVLTRSSGGGHDARTVPPVGQGITAPSPRPPVGISYASSVAGPASLFAHSDASASSSAVSGVLSERCATAMSPPDAPMTHPSVVSADVHVTVAVDRPPSPR
ncbi:hypothetical protein ACFVYR_30140 [Streptomyces sp. NPDC058284]|uniref:hypothetical protein n=1 Tax=unclassified Streptomyces TaxID=2593676 RepID=UPI00364FCAC7